MSVCGTGCATSSLSGFSRQGWPAPLPAPARGLPTRHRLLLARERPTRQDPDLPGSHRPRANRACPFARRALCPASPPHSVAQVQDYLPGCPSPTLSRQEPRLRSRLTLGRLPLPRNPQACGVEGSHLHRRYSFRHSRFGSLHQGSRSGFSATPERSPTAPGGATHQAPAASVCCLSPVTLSARRHSTSELLRTHSRMAASKPTSWLSARPHNLSHSAAS